MSSRYLMHTKRSSFTLQKVTFYRVKGRLLQAKTGSSAVLLDKDKMLIFKYLYYLVCS